jgi:hypothetical protein
MGRICGYCAKFPLRRNVKLADVGRRSSLCDESREGRIAMQALINIPA